jgi:hypothetical protein
MTNYGHNILKSVDAEDTPPSDIKVDEKREEHHVQVDPVNADIQEEEFEWKEVIRGTPLRLQELAIMRTDFDVRPR